MRAPAVICPLDIEAKAARRAIADAAPIITSGPGEPATRAAVKKARAAGHDALVLFGVAGAIRGTQTAAPIASVRTRTSKPIACPFSPKGAHTCTLHEPLYSAERKGVLAYELPDEVTLIDCESFFFAHECNAASIPWIVIRAVSDGPGDSLPTESINWTAPDGSTRTGQVIKSALQNPWIIPTIMRLGWQSSTALKQAAPLLARAIESLRAYDAPSQ